MGVSGAVGFIKRNRYAFSRQIELKNRTVIIDVTNALFWFIKETSLTNMDKYGTSMHELGKSYWNLLTRIKERDNTIHIVFNGPRPSDRMGPIVSKSNHLQNSAKGALRRLQNGYLVQIDQLPDLAMNCLKEIVNELQLPPDQVHQAEGEVYPTLVYLSAKYNATVLTNHSDFIFRDVPAGFVWLQELQLPSNSTQPLHCALYSHQQMLNSFSLSPEHSGALACLSVLLRDDFAENYYGPVNSCLNLTGHWSLTSNARAIGLKTRRLGHILENWPRELKYQHSVRRILEQHARTGSSLMRDFDALIECYCDFKPFANSELAQQFGYLWRDQSDTRQLGQALTRRESSAEFLDNVMQKNFMRTGIENVETFRSTFSLQDRAKQYLMSRLHKYELDLFDRTRNAMTMRQLRPASDQSERPLDRPTLFDLFHFRPATLESVAARLRESNQIDAIISNELALILLLASFALRLAPRQNYRNNRDESEASSANQQMSELNTKKKCLVAILNSFIYLQSRTSQGDQSPQDVPADIRVARGKVDEIAKSSPAPAFDSGSRDYFIHKHLIEALNSTLCAYKELNSLYNNPGPNLIVNKYYDGVIIYKLIARYSNNLQEHLLRLDENLLREL